MISRTNEELKQVKEKLKAIIEKKQSIQVILDTNTLIHFHDAILLTLLKRGKVTNLEVLKSNYNQVCDEVAEMTTDYYSEVEDLVYCVFDILKENKEIII